MNQIINTLKGGQGSGNFNHSGRPGEQGGSGAGINTKWNSVDGERTVIGVHESGKFIVETRGQALNQLISPKDLASEMSLDRRRLEGRQVMQEANNKIAEMEAAAKKEYENIDGFDAGMSALQRDRAIKVLQTNVSNKGRIITRRELVREAVNDGASVREIAGKPSLEYKNGVYIHMPKIATDYASYLIGRKVSKGGQGSGNHGHSGRPGERGGSGAGSSGKGRRNKKEKEQFGNVINEEKLAKHLGVPVNVARYMLAQGLVGVTIKDRPMPLSKDEVPKAEYDSADKKSHQGQCYDYASRYMLDTDFKSELKGLKVVHGTISDGVMTIGHAWTETPSGLLYEGSTGQFFKKADYMKKMNAVEERVYSREEARKNLVKYKHYGPWHNGAGYVRGAKGRKDE